MISYGISSFAGKRRVCPGRSRSTQWSEQRERSRKKRQKKKQREVRGGWASRLSRWWRRGRRERERVAGGRRPPQGNCPTPPRPLVVSRPVIPGVTHTRAHRAPTTSFSIPLAAVLTSYINIDARLISPYVRTPLPLPPSCLLRRTAASRSICPIQSGHMFTMNR